MAAENKGERGSSHTHRFVALGDTSLPPGIESAVVGSLVGKGLRIGIACSRFNFGIGTRLLEGARDQALRRGVAGREITVVFVPGAFELPMAVKALADSGTIDAIVCLGAVIRGETSHHELIAHAAASGCAHVQLDTGVPVAFGVLTTEDVSQAEERSGGSLGNAGAQAVDAAIEMARCLEALAKYNPGADSGRSSLGQVR